LLITHDPRVTFPAEYFRRILGGRMPHLAYSFNYSGLPTGARRLFHRRAFQTVTRFVVYSTLERQLYHDAFGIPLDKLDFVHWGVNPPADDGVPPPSPFRSGDYICAIGENSRDYATLIAAMRQLPDIPLVMVVRPHNLVGLSLPANVTVLTSIPFAQAMAVLRHSRFMALPLTGPDVPCGHVTLVNAMHLGKAFAITRSSGVSDYCRHDDNALLVTHRSADEMAGAIRRLWDDQALCSRLGDSGRRFAAEVCSEANIVANFRRLLSVLGLTPPPPPPSAPAQLPTPSFQLSTHP
jgi:glycosyltransferase involved in cell wall biosynthesis